MTNVQIDPSNRRSALRLWPGVIIVALQWLLRFGLPWVAPEAELVGVAAVGIGALGVVVWWVFFSRAPWVERLGAVALMVLALLATPRFLHESMATAGMGALFYIFAIPVLCLALVIWAAASRGLAAGPRRATLVATILVACGAWTLVRTGGVSASGSDLSWRWSKTPEERLLAGIDAGSTELLPVPVVLEEEAAWPGFRGADRDSIVPSLKIESDWSASPPVELWRRPIGPGWSSFAVQGDVFYTQEQRGDDELVVCYDAATGEPVWQHRDPARFWESNAGAGPRATPTLSRGRVYTMGATGILNALDAADGTVVWSRNAASDTGAEIPGWGFSSSPLVVDDLVIAYAGGLMAYDADSGEPRWSGPTSGSYSSPHLWTMDGVRQIVMLTGAGVIGAALEDGEVLWRNEWQGGIVQPAVTADGDLLINAGGLTGGAGIRRISVERGVNGWSASERWTSNRLKPNFSDFVVHEGHAYGFDGAILASIELEQGERVWKGGRYGNGQLLLLADQDLLLVMTERGDLALVAATPERFTELARFPALEGKTWNHPVLVGDRLLVRNGQEMVAFRLAVTRG